MSSNNSDNLATLGYVTRLNDNMRGIQRTRTAPPHKQTNRTTDFQTARRTTDLPFPPEKPSR